MYITILCFVDLWNRPLSLICEDTKKKVRSGCYGVPVIHKMKIVFFSNNYCSIYYYNHRGRIGIEEAAERCDGGAHSRCSQ